MEICVCSWHGYSFLREAGPPQSGNVCADGSRCVARLPVPARGGQLCSRNHVATLDAKLIDPTERFIASHREKRIGPTPPSPASQGHVLAIRSGSFPNSPCHFLRVREKPWHGQGQARTTHGVWAQPA